MSSELRLVAAFADHHPIAVARILERHDPIEAANLMGELEPKVGTAILQQLAPSAATRIVVHLSAKQLAAVTAKMPPGAAAALLRRLEPSKTQAALAELGGGHADRVRRVLSFPDSTIGAAMDPAAFAVGTGTSLATVLEQAQKDGHGVRYYVYVVDTEQRLVGVVTLREVMTGDASARVESLMTRSPESLPARGGLMSALTHPAWRRLHTLPVIDTDGRLLGALPYETLRAIERERNLSTERANISETASALAELFGVGLVGFSSWLASGALARSGEAEDSP